MRNKYIDPKTNTQDMKYQNPWKIRRAFIEDYRKRNNKVANNDEDEYGDEKGESANEYEEVSSADEKDEESIKKNKILTISNNKEG